MASWLAGVRLILFFYVCSYIYRFENQFVSFHFLKKPLGVFNQSRLLVTTPRDFTAHVSPDPPPLPLAGGSLLTWNQAQRAQFLWVTRVHCGERPRLQPNHITTKPRQSLPGGSANILSKSHG